MLLLDNVVFLYADPGAGALLLQMLMAAVFGGMFFFRSVRDRVLGLFRNKPAGTNSAAEDSPGDESE